MKIQFVTILLFSLLIVCCHDPVPVSDQTAYTNTYISNISFISPAAGDIWKLGERHEIKWKTIGKINSVKISLIKKQKYHQLVLAEKTENSGSFSCSIPGNIVQSVSYQVKIEDSENPENIYYSDVFEISD